MQFSGSIHSIKLDSEGEATLVLKVPSSELASVVELTAHTQELLKVSVEKLNA